MGRPTQLVLWVCLLAGLRTAPAGAHAQYKPFSTNRCTVLAPAPGAVEIQITVTVGDRPALTLRQRFDTDGDRRLEPAEQEALRAWALATVQGELVFTLDGPPIPATFAQAQLELVTDEVEMLAPLRFSLAGTLPVPPGRVELLFQDRSRWPELEQTELLIEPRHGVRLLRAQRPGIERGVEQRQTWERGALPGPVLLAWEPALEPAAVRSPGTDALEDEADALKRLLHRGPGGALALAAALGLAFLLGAAHALSPGHGKTLVAAYLVGNRGSFGQAALLGLTVTATHVAAVFALGAVALWASEQALPDRLLPWISLASGALVTALGSWMVVHRRPAGPLRAHRHPHGHQHDPQPPGAQGTTPVPGRPRVRLSELLVLGISGGLVPCPSATVVLLLAIYLGRIGLGMALLVAFSLGLASTLIAIGLLVVRSGRWLSGLGRRWQRLGALLPWISSLAVLGLGLAMTVPALLSVLTGS